MYRGIRDNRIPGIKRRLKALGYPHMTNNDLYDLQLEVAISAFQEANRLTTDHIIGPRTLAVLNSDSPEVMIDDIKLYLPVKWKSQRDNENVPGGTCNVTSLAMAFEWNGIEAKDDIEQLEDELFDRLLDADAQAYYKKNYASFANQGYNARNIHGMLVWLAKDYGLEASFSTKASANDIRGYMLDNKQPVITTGLFTRNGHIVCIIGYTEKGNWIVHDPYGDWNTGYKSSTGNARLYDHEDMWQVLRGNELTKYAHFIRKKNDN